MQKQLGITFVHVTHTQLEAIAVADMLVVMDQGRIEQSSSPDKIYNTPRTAYVARFIGGQNVLSGKVESVADGMATVRDAGGARLTAPVGNARPETGSQLYLSIRRDRIEVIKDNVADAGEANVVRGKVHSIEYQGSYAKVTIDLARQEEFVANVSDVDFLRAPVEIGDDVLARWSPAHVRLLEGAGGLGDQRIYADAELI
jgi:putative spermidine/putrescine transport system ATP-binding protein